MTDILAYGQVQPTEETALRALADLFGPELAEATWAAAVRGAGLTRPVRSVDDLQKVAEELTRVGNKIASLAGRSLRVRVVTYRALSAWRLQEQPPDAGDGDRGQRSVEGGAPRGDAGPAHRYRG